MSNATKVFFGVTAVLLAFTVSMSYLPFSEFGVRLMTTINGVSTLIMLVMSFFMAREDWQE